MSNAQKPNLGDRLRRLREEQGLSLNELAQMTGLARSTLYKVENSGMSLTYEKLLDLSRGLGVDIAELFRDPPANTYASSGVTIIGRREIGRNGEGDEVVTPNYLHYYLCNDLVQKRMLPMIGHVRSRTLEEFGELRGHSGEEFTYVLNGAIEVHTAAYRPVTLNKGDYIYLDSTMPHAYLRASDEDAIILTICTSPNLQANETQITPSEFAKLVQGQALEPA